MRILLLADIHIGKIPDTVYVYNVITDIIEKEIEHTKTDALVILGDYFNRLFRVNEEFVSLAINTMSYIVRACAKNKTKIRIVYGTESHEMNQYRLFNHHFTSHKVDMKLFTTCTEEELFPNVHVLYVPEEYVTDKHEFYKDTLYSKKYSYIFGHGNIVEGLSQNMAIHIATAKSLEKQVPRFHSDELSSACDVCAFGHYHVHTSVAENVFYVGSLFRSAFGEEEPKGYGIIEDKSFNFVENEEAYLYKTYQIDDGFESNDDVLKRIDEIKRDNEEIFNGEKVGKIRLIFNVPENTEPTLRESIQTLLFNDKIISPIIRETSHKVVADESSAVADEYEFILDNSLKITEKIHRFIARMYEEPIAYTDIVKYINEPLKI